MTDHTEKAIEAAVEEFKIAVFRPLPSLPENEK